MEKEAMTPERNEALAFKIKVARLANADCLFGLDDDDFRVLQESLRQSQVPEIAVGAEGVAIRKLIERRMNALADNGSYREADTNAVVWKNDGDESAYYVLEELADDIRALKSAAPSEGEKATVTFEMFKGAFEEKPLPPEFAKVLRDNYWELLDSATPSVPRANAEKDAERYRKLKAAITVPFAMQSFIKHMGWHPDTFKMGIDEAIDAALAEQILRSAGDTEVKSTTKEKS